MNNSGYYQNPVFPGVGLNNNTVPNQQSVPSYEQTQTMINPLTSEQSYIENILRLNRGKKAKLHVTVPGSKEWQDRVCIMSLCLILILGNGILYL